MDFWLDSTNVISIQKAKRLGLLSGVTTNPTLIAHADRNIESILKDLLHYQEGPIAVQVVADTVSEMVRQGQNLYNFSNRLIVKIPVTKSGLEAIYLLTRQSIPTMATAIFSRRQLLMASLAEAYYVVPYIGRIEEQKQNPWDLIQYGQQLCRTYHLKTKILAASLNHIDQVVKCAELGISAITVKEELFEQIIQDEQVSLTWAQKFQSDWETLYLKKFPNSILEQ